MIYSSNHLEYLCLKLAANLRGRGNNILGREVIVTQSAGMNAWLKTQISKMNGVFANFSFINQDGLFAEIYKILFGERFKNDLNEIRYKIYKFLDSVEFKTSFHDVFRYYKGDDLRRIQLADKITDLIDQYQLYRSDMIESWEKGYAVTENPAEIWQKWLWVKLDIESRVTAKNKIISEIKASEEAIKKNFPRISIFGITIFTEFHLEFFKELSNYATIDFYLCLPTDHKEFHNEHLISFGSKASELEVMSKEKLGEFEYIRENNEVVTSLARIQDQIVNDTNNLNFTDDGSVRINSCYTPAREAECLYNYLLDLFDKDRSLKPADVLVMATDINKYAPYVKAVFRDAPVPIPFQVSGAANNSEDTIAAAIEQILKFAKDDLTSEKVISLLEQKRIKQHFRIEDCDYIRSVIKKANIRFGHKNRTKDDTRFVGWKYGLEKILLGYAMLTDEEYPVSNNLSLYPLRDTEAAGSYDLFRLKAFVERLESVIVEQHKPRTLADWKKFLLEDVVEKMIFHDDFNKDDRSELASVYRALSYTDNLEFDEKVPFSVFLNDLNSKLFTESWEIRLNTGNVTVSSPVPVRGIPFRVICFLGLDNDVFPRRDQFMGFDLLGEDYLIGDRNKKETDKYLFLDTILSAREKLYLSYIGQNVKDNTEIPPSIVVDTFLDCLDSKTILQKHPLHGFSSQYNEEAVKGMFTFLYGRKKTDFTPKEPDPKKFDEISVFSFIKFFENPVDWYYDNILGIKYEEINDTLPETELFRLDSLQEWMVKQDLMAMAENEIDSYLMWGIKEGKLPLKNLGVTTVEDLSDEISLLKAKFLDLKNDREESNAVIDFSVGETRLKGTVKGIYGDKYITYAFSDRLKYKVRAYMNALLLYSDSKIKSVDFIYSKKPSGSKKIPSIEHEIIPYNSSEDAKQKISDLMIFFDKGKEEPLKFTPDAAKKVLKKEKVENIFLDEAEGNIFASLPPDYCIKNLYDDNYFQEFDIENFSKRRFDPEVYNQKRFEEIKSLAGLLNIKNK